MTYTDVHVVLVDAPPDQVWRRVRSLGGDDRFYVPGALWRVRGAADRLVGGPGFRIEGPGRELRAGDTMDFWEVVDVSPPHRLRLRAASRLPGTALVSVHVHPHGDGTELQLRTEFEPSGAAGHAYWWSTVLAHSATFARMARRLADLVGTPSLGARN